MTTSPLFKRVCGQRPRHESQVPDALTPFRKQIREWWSFNSAQRHTHSWHTREDFIKRLPEILSECGIHPAASPEPPTEEVETLRKRVKELEAALAPFSLIGGPLNAVTEGVFPDDASARFLNLGELKAKHFRGAATALDRARAKGNG